MLRQEAPIFYSPEWKQWFLTRYEDCERLQRDNRLGHGTYQQALESSPLWQMLRHWFLFKNPPDHTRLRRLVHKTFTPHRVAKMRETVQAVANHLLDKVQPPMLGGGKGGGGKTCAEGRSMDLIADFANPLPIMIIAEMLGFPKEDHKIFHQWSNDIARSFDLTDDVDVYIQANKAALRLIRYLKKIADQRRANPQNDLLSALVAVEEAGEQLSEEELYATCALLIVAGYENTTNFIGNGMLALLQNPAELERLKQNPQLMPEAIEELLRYDSSAQMTVRIALEEITYKGVTIHAGQEVNFVIGAANRDPDRFANPNTLDLTRSHNRHLSFGHGIHYCIGAPLARLEGEIAFTTLLRRMPNLSLATEKPTYLDNYHLRSLTTLPVTF
jgi:cytochrome P450